MILFFLFIANFDKTQLCNYPVIIKSCNVSPWSWMYSVYLINFKVYHDKEECIIYRVVTSARPCNKVGHLFWFTILAQHETNDVILYIHSVHTQKEFFSTSKLQNEIITEKFELNNSMQVKKILFTNVFFSW